MTSNDQDDLPVEGQVRRCSTILLSPDREILPTSHIARKGGEQDHAVLPRDQWCHVNTSLVQLAGKRWLSLGLSIFRFL